MAKFTASTLTESEQFAELLRQRRTHPDRQSVVDAEIYDRFLTTCAIVVVDMADFSRLTYAEGIIPTLQQIQTLRDNAIPFIQGAHGKVLKVEADNLYAVFDTVDGALDTLDALRPQLGQSNIHISVGIGYGEVLMIGDRNLFGHEMNVTSKLGEDLAGDNDILLSASAFAALSSADRAFTRHDLEISDVTLTYYQLQQ